MTDQTLPRDAAQAEAKPVIRDKFIAVAVLGGGGLLTFGWVGLLGWGMIHLIGSLTG